MIIKTINLGNREKALKSITESKNKNYGKIDIKIENLHLKDLNKLVGKMIFKKNDAFISGETLFELMQPIGEKNHHHFHNLSAETIFKTLLFLKKPYCILKTGANRYSILSKHMEKLKRIITIIEINANKVSEINKINKIVTIYPKDKINNYINGKTILYIDCD